MNYLTFLVIAVFVLAACNQSRKATTNDQASYLIAYNIHVPDTSKDDWEVMIMNFDGSNKRNVSNHPDVAWIYYSYGGKLYFISDRDTAYRHYFLYESDPDGSNLRKVTTLRLEDSWLSSRNDGKELVVCGRIGKEIRHQLFMVDTNSGAYRQLTTDTAAYYLDPCFSPDGSQIVYSYKKNRRDRSTHEELYRMNADGSDPVQLTHYPEDNPSAGEYGYRAGASRWHPTENFISYVSLQDGRHSIYAVTPDGTKQWKLIDNPDSEGWHDWSPDGKWLAFNSSDASEQQYHITLMNWETRESRQLTDTTYRSQQAPVFVSLK